MAADHDLPTPTDGVAGVSTFRIQLVLLITAYTLLVYGGIFILTRTMLTDSLRTQAESYLDLVVTAREWNALHGGVWVLKSEGVEANEYLRQLGVDPEIETATGSELVLRNPSPMTREISELTQQGSGVTFRLIGENPLNPANAPDGWELRGLEQIDAGQEWAETFERSPGTRGAYRYVRPLYVDSSCIGCHTAEQGYSPGMRKGGLSISIPLDDYDRQVRSFATALSALAILTLLVGLGIALTMVTRLRVRLNEANRRLRIMAVTDELTGVGNRRATLDRLSEELERGRRSNEPLSVISLDLDHFKNINDMYGHATGDCALREFVERVQSAIRAYDVFGRVGGEEFLILAPRTTQAEASALAERVLSAIRSAPLANCSRPIRLTASAGVAQSLASDTSADALLVRADEALYRAKAAGRDQVCTDA